MITQEDLPDLLGAAAHDPAGNKIGQIGQVYHGNATDRPTWATVITGLIGTTESFVPLQYARLQGRTVTLGHGIQRIKDAPRIAQDGYLSPKEEIDLYRYYGIAGHDRAGT